MCKIEQRSYDICGNKLSHFLLYPNLKLKNIEINLSLEMASCENRMHDFFILKYVNS